MKKTLYWKLVLLLLTAVVALSSCSKSKDDPTPDTKVVKYEITGNYSGRLLVVYTDKNGSSANEIVSALPWSKELTVQSSTISVGFGGQTAAPNYGANGQTVTAKLYVKNEVKQSGTAVADANGAIVLPNLAATLN